MADNTNETKVVDDIADRASKLKRAGLPIAIVVLLAIVGAPGFWEHFFNTTDEEAMAKVEISYQLLKQQTETLDKTLGEYRQEMNDIRSLLNSLLLQRAAVTVGGVVTPNALPAVVPPRMMAALPDTLDEAVTDTAVGREAMASAGLGME